MLVGACAVATTTGCGGSGPIALDRDASVEDATGDAPSSADITSVQLSDTSAGFLTFKIGLARRPSPQTAIAVFLDTDRNKATGAGTVGAEYALYADSLNESDPYVDFRQFKRKTNAAVDFNYTEEATVHGGVLRVRLNGFRRFAPGFNLAVATLGEKGKLDQAPDSGVWSYHMRRQVKPTLSLVGGVKTTPRKPRAGHRFAASIHVKGSHGVDVLNDTFNFGCPGTVGHGKPDLGGYPSDPSNATLRCIWRIPPGTSGRAFRGSLTIRLHLGGQTLSRSISARISP
jgi:hypothetical protein